MKHRNIGLGIFLLSIGIIWALINTGVINWSILDSLLVLWPLVLVVIGVVIVFRENAVVRVVAWLLFLAVVVSYSYFTEANAGSGNTSVSGSVSVEKLDDTKYGELKLALGGLRLNLDSNTDKLLEADVKDPDVKHSVGYRNNNETALLNFNKNRGFTLKRIAREYDGEFHLNRDVIWDMDLKVGAASGVIDLSGLKVRDLEVDAGACNLTLVCGSNYQSTNIRVNAGASKFNLVVPENAGVRIKVDGIFSRGELDSLGWERRDGHYVSRNYDTSESRIDVDMKLGAGKLSVDIRK